MRSKIEYVLKFLTISVENKIIMYKFNKLNPRKAYYLVIQRLEIKPECAELGEK